MCVNPEGVEPPLPDPKLCLVVDGRWQPQADQHPLAPWVLMILPQNSENSHRAPLLELLYDPAGGFGGLRLHQEMKMVRHQDPAQKTEFEFPPQLFKHCHKFPTK